MVAEWGTPKNKKRFVLIFLNFKRPKSIESKLGGDGYTSYKGAKG